MTKHSFYEFFAGGGMARLGLGDCWKCLLANDIDEKKAATYGDNFGKKGLICGDIHSLQAKELPGHPDLAWGSFPCQDLSLAGNRLGLAGERSGAFWGFWTVINGLKADGRAPKLLVLENVIGTLTSHGGRDFLEIGKALVSLGYVFGAVVIDAVHFLPQSRPRLFIVCIKRNEAIDPSLLVSGPVAPWHSDAINKAVAILPPHLKEAWRWWRLPSPPERTQTLADILEPDDEVENWHSESETHRLLGMMSTANAQKVAEARLEAGRVVGTIYKRTRDKGGLGRVQRAEVRFDGVAGCLRTPGGGSSRQIVLIVDGNQTRSRLLTVREAAQLMGVPKSYKIPTNYNDGYHVFGDGLAVPAVAFLEQNLLDRLLFRANAQARNAA